MNAVDRVMRTIDLTNCSYDFADGYRKVLIDVQEEIEKEVGNNWETEITALKDKHRCEIAELEKCFEDKNKNSNEMIRTMGLELVEYKAKWEAVKLIFGGK